MKKFKDILNEMQSTPDMRLHSPKVNYFGPEKGPFKCGHCEYFDSVAHHCGNKNVDAPVDTNGCCNLYEPINNAK